MIVSHIVISDKEANIKIATEVQMLSTCKMIKNQMYTMLICLYTFFGTLNLLVNRINSSRFTLASPSITV